MRIDQEHIELSEVIFKSLIENSHEAFSICDKNFNVIYRSPSALRITGYTYNEQNEVGGIEQTHPDDIANLKLVINEVIENPNKPILAKFRTKHKLGHYIWMEGLFTNKLEDEGIKGIIINLTDISEKIKFEENNQLFTSIINSSHDAILSKNLNGIIISWNLGAEKIFGYLATEIIGKTILTIIPTDLIQEETDIIEKIKNGEVIDHYETKRIRKDGKLIDVSITVSPINDLQGNIIGASKIARDITKQKNIESEILQLNANLDKKVLERTNELLLAKNELTETLKSEQFLASITKNIHDPIIATDNNFIITKWNKAAEKLFEWKSKEVIGKAVSEVLNITYPHETKEQILVSFTEKGYWQGDVIYHSKSKNPIHALATVSQLKDVNDDIIGSLALVKDITERIKLEKKLKEFEHFFINSNDLSCIANKEGYFEIINPSFEKMLGYNPSDFLKNSFINFVHPDDVTDTLEAYEKLKSGKTLSHFFNRYRKKDGEYLLLDWNATPNTDTGKIYCIARDITDRKKAEDALNKLNEELEQKVKERTEKLAASEMRFRMLIENSADGIDLSDEFSNNIYRSPGAVKITGILQKDNQRSLTHPDDVEIIKNKSEELIKKPGIPIAFQARFRHALGHYIWLEGTLTNLLHVEGVHAIVTNFRDITQRKELEVLLHKANVLARIGSWEINMIKETVYWSDIVREIHEVEEGFVPDLATGINFYKEGSTRDLITQKVKEAIEQGKPWDVELQIITGKNNERWVRSIGETEFVDGKCARIYGSFQDIDKGKKVEAALLHSEAKARRIFESDMIGFIFWSEKGQILEANDYFLNMTGYTREDLEKGLVNWAAMTPPEYAHMDISSLKQIEATGICKPFEKEYIRKDGSRFPIILGAATLGENSEGVGVCYVMDITERKKAEIETERLNERLQLATKSAQLGLWDWDVKNNKLIWDEAMYKLYNLAENEFTTVYDGWASRMHEEDRQRVDNDIQLALEGKKDYNPEFRIVWTDTSVHYIKASGIIERDPNGNAVRMTGFNWDITERKKAEIELANKIEELESSNQELEQFAYIASHDLQEPLRMVGSYMQLIERRYKGKLDSDADEFIHFAIDGAARMKKLIGDLLNYSRINKEVSIKPISLTALMNEVIQNLSTTIKEKNAIINFKDLPIINADKTQMVQLFQNLISNSIKFTKEGVIPLINIKAEKQNNYWLFSINDNGIGIEEQYSDKIFIIFKQLHTKAKYGGTGIGLAIAKKIIEKQGGNIWFESEIGKGTTFYFTLNSKI